MARLINRTGGQSGQQPIGIKEDSPKTETKAWSKERQRENSGRQAQVRQAGEEHRRRRCTCQAGENANREDCDLQHN